MLFGSGGIQIGQAGEFDYSGSQAIKALKDSGIFVVLINPNPASVQTDEDMASRVYFEKLIPEKIRPILEEEKPEGVLLGFGGANSFELGTPIGRSSSFRDFT